MHILTRLIGTVSCVAVLVGIVVTVWGAIIGVDGHRDQIKVGLRIGGWGTIVLVTVLIFEQWLES
jgi:hypothetical protein